MDPRNYPCPTCTTLNDVTGKFGQSVRCPFCQDVFVPKQPAPGVIPNAPTTAPAQPVPPAKAVPQIHPPVDYDPYQVVTQLPDFGNLTQAETPAPVQAVDLPVKAPGSPAAATEGTQAAPGVTKIEVDLQGLPDAENAVAVAPPPQQPPPNPPAPPAPPPPPPPPPPEPWKDKVDFGSTLTVGAGQSAGMDVTVSSAELNKAASAEAVPARKRGRGRGTRTGGVPRTGKALVDKLASAGAQGDPEGAGARMLVAILEDMQEGQSKALHGLKRAGGAKDIHDQLGGSLDVVEGSIQGTIPGGGLISEPMFKLPRAILSVIDAIDKMSASVNQANFQFAQYSPSMAWVEAKSEYRQMVLDRERGENRAEAADRVALARDRRLREEAAISDWFHNDIQAPGLERGEGAYADQLRMWREMLNVMGAGIPEPGAVPDIGPLEGWMQSVTDARMDETYGRRAGTWAGPQNRYFGTNDFRGSDRP